MKTWQVLLNAVRFVPWLWIGNLVGITIIFVSFQVAGLMTREFFNMMTGDAPVRFGYWMIIALLVAGGLSRIFGIVFTLATNIPMMYRVAALLQKNILGRILSLPGARAFDQSPGEAISRFRGDVDTIRGFSLSFNDLIAGLIQGGISLVVMFMIDERIAALCMIPILAVMFLVYFVRSRVEAYSRAARKAAGIVTGFIGELFGAVQAVKVAGSEESMIGRFRTLNRSRSQTALRDRLFDQVLHAIFHNAVNISTAVIMIVAAESMKSGDFTVGDFALFVYYLPFLAEMTWMLGSLLVRYRRAGVAVERMETLMQGAEPGTLVKHGPIYVNDDAPDLPVPERRDGDILQSIEVDGLSYTFPDSENGIKDVSFSISRGSFTVITGRVGSGKTTLLRTMLGLLPKDRGDVRWNGKEIEALDDFFVPPRSAYTPQIPWLYSASLKDNLLMGLPVDNGLNVDDAIAAAVMEDDLKDLDDGLDTVVGPKGVRLSGGQMQRTAAARMFLRNPELFVFDDLSSALDVETEKKLWDRMFERRKSESSTCLVVSHRRAALRHADQIVVMKDGKLEAFGQLDELLESCDELKRCGRGKSKAPEAGASMGEDPVAVSKRLGHQEGRIRHALDGFQWPWSNRVSFYCYRADMFHHAMFCRRVRQLLYLLGAVNDLPGTTTAFRLQSILPECERIPDRLGDRVRACFTPDLPEGTAMLDELIEEALELTREGRKSILISLGSRERGASRGLDLLASNNLIVDSCRLAPLDLGIRK